MLAYTAEQLIESVRNLAMIPDSGSTGSEDADLLRTINESVRLQLYPRVLKLREGYFVRRERITLGTGYKYRVPERAMYDKVQNVWYIDDTGTRQVLAPVPPIDAVMFSEDSAGAEPIGYFLEGTQLCLHPMSASSFTGQLEVEYFMRPGDLVLAADYVTVATVPTTTSITYNGTAPLTWAADTEIDIHDHHVGADLKQWGLTIHSINTGTKTIVFHEDISGTVFGRTAVTVNDYVCNAEEAALPMLARELQPLIPRAAALQFAEAIGDVQQSKVHAEILEQQLGHILGAMESRVEHRPLRITGRRSFL